MQSKTAFKRTLLFHQVADASERVNEEQELIDHQRTHIQMLRQCGRRTEMAEAVLAQLEQSLEKFKIERDVLAITLASIG